MFRGRSRPRCMDTSRFASLPQLHPLSHEQLEQIAPHARERVVPVGRRLLLDGPFAEELVLIAGGRGLVRCAGETVAEIGPGDAFGGLAPERSTYATATVTALTELRLVVISARALRGLRQAEPQTAAALVAACAADPGARVAAAAGPRPGARLSLVRRAA